MLTYKGFLAWLVYHNSYNCGIPWLRLHLTKIMICTNGGLRLLDSSFLGLPTGLFLSIVYPLGPGSGSGILGPREMQDVYLVHPFSLFSIGSPPSISMWCGPLAGAHRIASPHSAIGGARVPLLVIVATTPKPRHPLDCTMGSRRSYTFSFVVWMVPILNWRGPKNEEPKYIPG